MGIKYLEKEFDIKFEDYADTPKKEVDLPEEKSTSSECFNSNLNNEIVTEFEYISKKLDELISAINKLGNIEMQQLEYLKEIKDKPTGYVKPFVR